MTPLQEMEFEKKAAKHFKSQRALPNGRDYRWNCFRYISRADRDNFRKNSDKAFPGAPGSTEWLDGRFCPKCDKIRAWCECSSKR